MARVSFIDPRSSPRLLHRRTGVLGASLLFLFFLLTPTSADEPADSTAGQLLVATPEMTDPRFVETVIFVVKHNSEGTLGLVINRPLAKGPIEDLLKGFGANSKGAKGEIIVHYGGPVGTNQGFLLHTEDAVLDSSIRVKGGTAVTSDAKLIEAISHGKGPKQFLFMLGYAGWAPGQLEAELKANAWYVVPGDKALIFGKDAEKKWHQAMDKRRISL
jgi:putative transcriptional regulator